MKLLITGATGLVGKALIEQLFARGYEDINILTRDPKRAQDSAEYPINCFAWDPGSQTMDDQALKGVGVVIHLAGEGIASKRWSVKQKKRIKNSRVQSTKLILDRINAQSGKIKFISTSAIGYYGDQGSELISEENPPGSDFLSEVCIAWEDEARKSDKKNINTYILRLGMVLSDKGGALDKLLPLFKSGLGGPIGTGKRFMSWIHIEDLVNLFIFLIENNPKEKVFNAVAPNSITNSDFTHSLGKALGVIAVVPAPPLLIQLALGEMARIILTSQKVSAKRIINAGFNFKYDQIDQALGHLLQHEPQGESVVDTTVWVNNSVESVFQFFSDEKNLEKITPPSLNFKVLKKSTDKIEKGTLINYKLNIHGLPFKWQSLIKDHHLNSSFVDIQVSGPYSKWEHTHTFIKCKGGTLIKDQVIYKIPLGLIGRFFAGNFVKKDVNKIFNYRTKFIKKFFQPTVNIEKQI